MNAMNVPFQNCFFTDVVCELVADFSCLFHCLACYIVLIAFCMWFNKGQAAWFGLAWLPVVCEKYTLDNKRSVSINRFTHSMPSLITFSRFLF